MDFLRQLAIKINTVADTTGIKKTDVGLQGVIAKAKSLGVLLGAGLLARGMKNFVEQGIAFGDHLADQSKRIGVSIEDLQKWNFVSEKAGVNAESFAKAMGFLNKNLGEAQLGSKKANETFAQLDIQLKNQDGSWKTSSQVLSEFSDHMAKLPTLAQKTAYAAKLTGKGGKELAIVFGEGSAAVQEQLELMEKYNAILDGDSAKALDAYKDRVLLTKTAFEVLKARVAMLILPLLERVNVFVLKGVKVFGDLIKQSVLFKAALVGLGVAGLGIAAFFSPLLATVMAIAAGGFLLYVVFEDIYYFLTGKGNSAIQSFLEDLLGMEDATTVIKNVRKAFSDLIAAFKDPQNLQEFKVGLDELVLGFKALAFGIRSSLRLTGLLVKTLAALKNPIGALKDGTFSSIYEDLKSIPSEFKTNFNASIAPSYSKFKADNSLLQYMRGPAAAVPLITQAASNRANTNNVTNTFNITGSDPKSIANEVKKFFDTTLVQAKDDFITVAE